MRCSVASEALFASFNTVQLLQGSCFPKFRSESATCGCRRLRADYALFALFDSIQDVSCKVGWHWIATCCWSSPGASFAASAFIHLVHTLQVSALTIMELQPVVQTRPTRACLFLLRSVGWGVGHSPTGRRAEVHAWVLHENEDIIQQIPSMTQQAGAPAYTCPATPNPPTNTMAPRHVAASYIQCVAHPDGSFVKICAIDTRPVLCSCSWCCTQHQCRHLCSDFSLCWQLALSAG